MRIDTERETLGARRRGSVIAVTAFLLGGWTAWAREPAPFPQVESQETPSVESTPEAKKEKPARSVWDGVYTEEQAARGRKIFRSQCADCHKPEEFAMGYRTANDLFSSRDAMPQSSPASLSAQEYADLIAYVFESNGFPYGGEELQGDTEVLEGVRIEDEKPMGR